MQLELSSGDIRNIRFVGSSYGDLDDQIQVFTHGWNITQTQAAQWFNATTRQSED